MMNLAVVVEQFDRDGGGLERSTAQIITELKNRGHRVTMLAGRCAAGGELEGVATRRYSHRKPRLATQWLGFRRWTGRELNQGRFDATLSMTTLVPAMVVQPRGGVVREMLERAVARPASPWSRLVKRAAVGSSLKYRVMLHLEGRTFRDPTVRCVAAVSRYLAEQLGRHYGVDASRVLLIPNAAEVPRMSVSQRRATRLTIRRELGIPENASAYLFAAYDPKRKGLEPFLEGAAEVTRRGVDAVFLLAGRVGYRYHDMADRLGIRDRVRIIGPTKALAGLYVAADVTVLPTFYDPASKVVIESLMMGTPAITTSYNGAADFLVDGQGRPIRGRVVAEPWDVEGLAGAMSELADPGVRRLCIEATDGLAESLSMRRHVDQLESLLVKAAQVKG